jgi:hypothetical protein
VQDRLHVFTGLASFGPETPKAPANTVVAFFRPDYRSAPGEIDTVPR